MAETLINLNQNQLNTQNGSFTELIKSTQQGKEKLATALVDKGANVSSSSTLTDMATATSNLATFNGISPVIGNTVEYRANSDTTYFNNYICGAYVNNAYGSFRLTFTSATNFRIYNVSANIYTTMSSTYTPSYKDFTLNSVASNLSQNLFWVSDDGTIMFYVSSDKSSIYKYTIDYSGVDSTALTNISVALSNTYSVSGLASSLNQVLAYNEDTSDIIIKSASSYSSTTHTFYKCHLNTTATLTTLTKSFTTGGGGCYFCPISTNLILYTTYSSPYLMQLLVVDYTDNTITGGTNISISNSSASSLFSIYSFFNKVNIGGKQYLAFIANNVDEKLTSNLILINCEDGTYTSYSHQSLLQSSVYSSNNSTSSLTNACPTFVEDNGSVVTIYLSGGILGNIWKIDNIDSVNHTFDVTDLKTIQLNTSDTYFGTTNRMGITVYNDTNNSLAYFTNNSSGYVLRMNSNQIIAYEYNGVLFIPNQFDYSDITTTPLTVPSTDVLEEDN